MMADEPIEPLNYIHGPKVVDIGDVRVARGLTRRPASSCNHHSMAYDTQERRIWCKDCEKTVDPFDAFVILTEGYWRAIVKLDEDQKRVSEAMNFQARSLAARALDEIWRKKNVVPACPSCGEGLFPHDFKDGVATRLGVEYASARRNARIAKKTQT